jgi:BirA family biotin operon repressor/biotin-[acetyl-CoA-carboxylase] ligase
VDGRKISGVLCEAKGERFLIGIGVNCKQEQFPEFLKMRATSLMRLGLRNCEPMNQLEDLLKNLKAALTLKNPLDQLREMLYLAGESVVVATGLPESGTLLKGTLTGIGRDGQLLIANSESGEINAVASGELVLKNNPAT